MRRALWLLAFASLGVTLVAMLWFVARTLPVRIPYWGEAETVFEAARLRAHEPLFVDPLVGAADSGVPPSRWYVTYPPVFTALVALFPASVALVAARVVSTVAWLGTLAVIAWRSKRVEAAAAAAFIAGIWVLANFATVGRPDSVAIAIAAAALWRAAKRDRLDALTIALFVLAPWTKPTLLGLPAGALLAHRDRRGLALAAGLAVVSALVAYVATDGQIFTHVIRSNAQPFSLSTWLAQVPARLPFFGPLIAWAAWLGWRARERVALGALAGATAWTILALAKTGSASNYWMEPCVAALVVIARAGPSPRDARFALAAAVAVLWADVAAVHASFEHAAGLREDAAFVASVRARCPDGVVMADEAGIELALDARIVIPTYQFVHLVRAGKFPASTWIDDLERASCYVEHTHQLDLAPELAAARARLFDVADEEHGFRIWVRRERHVVR